MTRFAAILPVREVGLARHAHVPLADILCDGRVSGQDVLAALVRALRQEVRT